MCGLLQTNRHILRKKLPKRLVATALLETKVLYSKFKKGGGERMILLLLHWLWLLCLYLLLLLLWLLLFWLFWVVVFASGLLCLSLCLSLVVVFVVAVAVIASLSFNTHKLQPFVLL